MESPLTVGPCSETQRLVTLHRLTLPTHCCKMTFLHQDCGLSGSQGCTFAICLPYKHYSCKQTNKQKAHEIKFPKTVSSTVLPNGNIRGFYLNSLSPAWQIRQWKVPCFFTVEKDFGKISTHGKTLKTGQSDPNTSSWAIFHGILGYNESNQEVVCGPLLQPTLLSFSCLGSPREEKRLAQAHKQVTAWDMSAPIGR